jgi:hypothetical protein
MNQEYQDRFPQTKPIIFNSIQESRPEHPTTNFKPFLKYFFRFLLGFHRSAFLL